MGNDDDLTSTQWLATLLVLLILLVPLATALAVWFRQRYVRAIVGLQASLAEGVAAQETAAPAPPAGGSSTAPAPAAPALQIDDAQTVEAEPLPAARAALRVRRRILAVQFVAGLTYWWLLLLFVVAALAVWMEMSGEALPEGDEASALVSALVFLPLLAMPPMLAWAFSAALPERRVWLGAAIGAALFGLGLYLSSGEVLAALLFALPAALTAALLAAFLRPAVRGAGPPLVAALTVGLIVFAVQFGIGVALDTSDDGPMSATDWAIGIAILLAMALPAAWAARRMLMRIARRYRERRFSELQIALGAYWGLMTAFVAGAVLLFSFDARTGAAMEWLAAALLLAWFGWRLLQRLGLWWARRKAAASVGALLMLRVFKPSSRSEAFNDRFLARWRFAGPVWMIAGPDLAGAQMEPDEFFALITGTLRERFVARPADVPAALATLDDRRDPDGRFRVQELFCSNAAWKDAVLALMERAAVVVLDLREYHAQRRGTRFELEQLLTRVPRERVLIVADAGDDPKGLAAAVADAAAAAPGAAADPRPLKVLRIGAGTDRELDALYVAAVRATQGSADRAAQRISGWDSARPESTSSA